MSQSFFRKNAELLLFLSGFLIFFGIFLYASHWPLQGIHSHRQADTLYSAYSYCFEGTEFLKPKIAQRMNTSGISIGEFPIFSYLIAIPCKLTGQWSETFPQYVGLILGLLCTFAWGVFLRRRYFPENQNLIWAWAGIFFFMIAHLIHLTIPIPDAFASLLIALAGLVDQPRWQRRTLSYLLFVLAFMVRPYFFLLAFLIYENFFVAVGALAACGGPYLFWFKYWIKQSELDYYATEVKTFSQFLKEAPVAVGQAPIIFIRNHMNFVLIIPFIRGVMKQKKWAFYCLVGWVVVVVLRGDHYTRHTYYLASSSLFAAAIILAGYLDLKFWQKITILSLSILIGLANTQHLWLSTQSNYYYAVQSELERNHVPPDAKIAAYVGYAPQFLYWAKHTGWLLEPDEIQKGCPVNYDFKLFLVDKQLHIEPCH